jgi:hypothetical protein
MYWWKFADAGSYTAIDSADSNSNMSVSGPSPTTGVQSVANTAYTFVSAAFDSIAFPVDYSPTGEFGFTAWVKPTDMASHRTVWGASGGASSYYLVNIHKNGGNQFLNMLANDPGGNNYSWSAQFNALTDGQWHHIAVTQTGGVDAIPIMYIDGYSYPVTTTGSGTISLGSMPQWIGVLASYGTYYYDGDMSLIRIYDRPLSAPEVLAIYNLEKLQESSSSSSSSTSSSIIYSRSTESSVTLT